MSKTNQEKHQRHEALRNVFFFSRVRYVVKLVTEALIDARQCRCAFAGEMFTIMPNSAKTWICQFRVNANTISNNSITYTMEVYRRYASRDHDKRHFSTQLASGHITLRPLSFSFDSIEPEQSNVKSVEYWQTVFENAAFFSGVDSVLFGPVLTAVYKNHSTDKLCTLSITKFGCNVYENLILDPSSRFWPACQNLPENMRSSNVRRALAVSNLKNYNKLWNNKGLVEVTQHWDETNAGDLAEKMHLLESLSPKELGNRILSLGIIQELTIPSFVVDVIYDNTPENVSKRIVEENNKLVMSLGKQLDLLFDPLLEYSPQAMEIEYEAPANPQAPVLFSNVKIDQVIEELIAVQTNYTNDLVNLLQNFIIPLRVSVLASSSNSGMMKVNLAFPPTIDEITRVNCIVHHLLVEARSYGYVEIFKVLGSFLRFFYKAFVRHQANLINFNSRFDKFVENNFAYAFQSQGINIGKFAPRAIKTIIVDSVLELPRLKLIIKRLYETIKEEKDRLDVSVSLRADEDAEIETFYSSAMSVIDSFGFHKTDSSSKARVFTPSGKLLTELATEWPSELQYGWISRKVIGIFNLENTKSVSENEYEIAIVFSDLILFLEVLESCDSEMTEILPDILMDSLINEKPLPKLSALPKLRVRYWCPINNMILRSFQGDDGYCLNITTLNGNRFKNKDETEILFVENYRMPQLANSLTACNKIIDVVSKAQVLCKSTPFHLFKDDGDTFERYFCAHEYSGYDGEISKSPIALFLNINDDQLRSVVQNNPLIFFAVSISLVNDHTVSLVGRDRQENMKIEEIVSLDDLKITLKEIMVRAIDGMFHSSYCSKVITEGNLALLNQFLLISGNESGERNKSFDTQVSSQKEGALEPKSLERKVEQGKKSQLNSVSSDTKRKSMRRKSGIFKLLEKLKHKSEYKETHSASARKPAIHLSAETISNTYIPKGTKKVYKNLYKPEPVLRNASITSSVQAPENLRQPEDKSDFLLQPDMKLASNTETIEAQSHFISAKSHEEETGSGTSDLEGRNAIAEAPCPTNFRYPESRLASSNTRSSSNYNDTLSLEQVLADNNQPHISKSNSFIAQAVIATSEQSHSNSANTTLFNPLKDTQTSIIGAEDEKVTKMDDTNPSAKISVPLANSGVAVAGNSSAPYLKIDPQKLLKPPKVPQHKVIPLFEEIPATKRVASGQDIAKALDESPAIGILPEVHDQYKIYDIIPNSIFSSDGLKNWTCSLSESTSNLQAEIRAMKEERHMDSEEIIEIQHLMSATRSDMLRGASGTNCSSKDNTSVIERKPMREVFVLNSLPRDESTQSVTPEQMAIDFGSQLDQNFDLEGIDLDRSLSTLTTNKLDPIQFAPLEREKNLFHSLDFGNMDFDSSNGSIKTHTEDFVDKDRALGQKRQLLASTPTIVAFEPLQHADLSTTDEEYFLSSEIMFSNEYLSENIRIAAPSSPSSEKTLQSDVNYIAKGESLLADQFMSESMAYLSGILRGDIAF